MQTAEKLEEAARLAEEEEEKNNPMKLLEKRTVQSRVEMERIEELEELKELNERQATVDFEGMINRKKQQMQQLQQETEEQRQLRENQEVESELEQLLSERGIEKRNGVLYKRVRDVDSDEEEKERLKRIPKEDMLGSAKLLRQIEKNKLQGLIRVKKGNETSKSDAGGNCATLTKSQPSGQAGSSAGGLSLVAAYSDSDNSD